ncbi:autotransporter outer membrane beta-barrel domain-containing protein [Endomicrobium proavitum]|uniref:OmpA-like domain-containing protein n=1 Tax=Endomicrobium proavitum TaxID=1408281 RepID=A0A0G3WI49_9BACT|nr:autotransporter outer membrane beta-barrel domain-containing protein [Endomicrobium proavitum]AKL97560.1 membrane protein of unknown function [Endomicrobium proavitum]
MKNKHTLKLRLNIYFAAAICLSLFLFVSSAFAVEELVSLAALNNAVLKAGSNSLNKRLGDLRRTPESAAGVWFRGYYNETSRYGAIDLDANISGAEAGVDALLSSDASHRFYIGVLGGYMGADNYQDINKIQSRAPFAGLYGTWFNDAGWFVDATARYFFYETKDILAEEKTNWGMWAVSAEAGKEFKMPINARSFFKLEPKVKFIYGQISAETLNAIDYVASNVFFIRPALYAGYAATVRNGAIVEPYIEFGFNGDLSSDLKVNSVAYNVKGGSFDIGGGVNFIVTDIISLYTYAGYEKGDKIANLATNVGVRLAIAGVKHKEKTNADTAADAAVAQSSAAASDYYVTASGSSLASASNDNASAMSAKNSNSGEVVANASNANTAEKTAATSNAAATSANGKTSDAAAAAANNNVAGNINGAAGNSADSNVIPPAYSGSGSSQSNGVNASKKVHFEFGKYEITPSYAKYLQSLAPSLKNNQQIEIDGHTDRTGPAEYNQILSEHRAKAVYDELVNLGIAKEKMIYKGYGFTRPLNNAHTREADAENRRVEIIIVK